MEGSMSGSADVILRLWPRHLSRCLLSQTDEAPGLAEPTEAPEPTGALEATEAAETPAVAADETDPAQVRWIIKQQPFAWCSAIL